MPNNKNILLATMISMAILLGWTWFYEKPKVEKREAMIEMQKAEMKNSTTARVAVNGAGLQNGVGQDSVQGNVGKASSGNGLAAQDGKSSILTLKNREELLEKSKHERVKIESENLHGTLYLKGARFDDLTLAKYFQKIDDKQEVTLFAPADSKERYFADFGWISSDSSLELPNPNTVWKSNGAKLTPTTPIILSWRNKQNVEFLLEIALDENYMFDVKQSAVNHSGKDFSLASYGRVNRVLNVAHKPNYILHEGLIGVFDDVLHETTYKDIAKEKSQSFTSKSGGWLGITDKYWLSSIIPDKSVNYKSDFSYSFNNQNQIFNAEFVGQEFKLEAGSTIKFDHKLFAGAKQVKLLDKYSADFDIKLFDRAIDFGWFYFLTKPFYFAIAFLHKFLGNFGLAILAMTVLIKLVLFPMANKSYLAIARMKKLQPKIEEIRKKFKDDKIAMNREVMEMYKREKINPASGCLPVLIQIPIFFSLYKVIFVTLDMRQAPFYGWIHDLSAPDPTSLFNLFGLLPYNVSGALAIGVWPVLMGVTMVLQQKLSPQVGDATQAKVLKYMPYVLTFVLAAFPAGLVIYWTWNNLLSIAQQLFITKRVAKAKE